LSESCTAIRRVAWTLEYADYEARDSTTVERRQLRYIVIGDTAAPDIPQLSALLRAQLVRQSRPVLESFQEGMNDKSQTSWETFLNPAILRPTLIIASVYIAAFELLKAAITDQIRSFYTSGFDQNGWRIGPKYQSEVLSKNPSPVYASLEWLKEAKAIDDADVAAFKRVKKLRNELVHTLTQLLSQGLPADLAERFSEMVSLLDKIERWWIVNVEIPTNPDLEGEEIDEAKVIPGPVIVLRLLVEIALGSEEESRQYINEFIKRTRKR
jgi:hypothetical protein